MAVVRGILAVIAGYLAAAVWVMATLTVSWIVLGASFAFEEGTTRTSAGWCILALVLGFPGAMLGGWVAAIIARSPTNRPVKILAGLMLVLGLMEGVVAFQKARTTEPAAQSAAEMSFMEAATAAVQPAWYSFSMPFVATAGVLFGGGWSAQRTLRRRPQAQMTDEP